VIALVLVSALLGQSAPKPAPAAAVFLTKRVGTSPERANEVLANVHQALASAGVKLLSLEEAARQAKAAGVADTTSCEGRKSCALDLGRKLGLAVVVPVRVGEVQSDLSVYVEALVVTDARKLSDETLIVAAASFSGLPAQLRPFAERVRAAMPAEKPAEPLVAAVEPPPEVVLPPPRAGVPPTVWGPAAGGAALAATGGLFFVLAKRQSDALSGSSGAPSTLSGAEAVTARDTGRQQQNIGLVLTGAGVVALGVAAGLHLFGGESAPVAAAPFALPGGGGLAFTGALP
jgi:hypothetical protein